MGFSKSEAVPLACSRGAGDAATTRKEAHSIVRRTIMGDGSIVEAGSYHNVATSIESREQALIHGQRLQVIVRS